MSGQRYSGFPRTPSLRQSRSEIQEWLSRANMFGIAGPASVLTSARPTKMQSEIVRGLLWIRPNIGLQRRPRQPSFRMAIHRSSFASGI